LPVSPWAPPPPRWARKAAFACTAAVEEVIDEHYAAQIEALKDKDPALTSTVQEFPRRRGGPSRHSSCPRRRTSAGLQIAQRNDQAGCRIAIKLSEKI
jgi:ubiquinone biosynthesis monooxygenase Coq7